MNLSRLLRSRHTISNSKDLIKIPEETLWIFKSFSLPLGKAKMPLANVIFAENPVLGRGIFYAKGFLNRNPRANINQIPFTSKKNKRKFN